MFRRREAHPEPYEYQTNGREFFEKVQSQARIRHHYLNPEGMEQEFCSRLDHFTVQDIVFLLHEYINRQQGKEGFNTNNIVVLNDKLDLHRVRNLT